MSDQDPEEVRKQAECERLIRAAHVSRMRGDYAQAGEMVARALELRPQDLEARELAADVLFAHGDIEKAAAEYKAIFEADKSRASAEEKFARATIQLAEGKRQQDLMQQMLDDPTKFKVDLPPRNAYVAAALSALPGLGHFYCGEYIRGIVVCLAAIFSWLLFLAFLGPASEDIVKRVSASSTVFLCLAVLVHVYAPIDASRLAEKSHKGIKSLTEPS